MPQISVTKEQVAENMQDVVCRTEMEFDMPVCCVTGTILTKLFSSSLALDFTLLNAFANSSTLTVISLKVPPSLT